MKHFNSFPLEYHSVTVADRDYRFAMVENAWELLDKIDPEEFKKTEKMPYWAEIWPGSVVLSRYLLSALSDTRLQILEVGAGVGVTGVILAANGFPVIATDYDTDALEFIQLNASLNGTTLTTRFLDWFNPGNGPRVDLIVGSDIIYEVRNLLPLLDVLRIYLKPGGCFYFSDPGRRPMAHFRTLIQEAGYHIEAVYSEQFSFRHATPTVTIYKVQVT